MPSWPNGIGQSLGDSLVTGKPLLTSYTTYFVSAISGNDSTNNGLDPDSAYATIAKAIAVALAGGVTPIIVCLSGHAETITAMTPSDGTIIVGAGSTVDSTGRTVPTVQLRPSTETNQNIITGGNGFQLRNIRILENGSTSTGSRVKLTGINCYVSGCYFDCGATDNGAAVEMATGSSGSQMTGCTFVSTATTSATKPSTGLSIASGLTDIGVQDTAFDEGTYGFSSQALKTTGVATRMRMERISLLHGANATLLNSTGIFMPTTVTGAGTISYNAGGA